MPVHFLTFEPSQGLAAELAVHDEKIDAATLKAKLKKSQKRFPTPETFFGPSLKGPLRDLAAFLKHSPRGLKVLDVGFGPGESTVYLASLGHNVTGLEPSLRACSLLDGLAIRYGFHVNVYCGTGEILDQLPEANFDLIVFNASLHHCDDPQAVLNQCRKRLKSGGQIFLHEPILKPFRTKAWYQRMLEEQPERMGHYGGNEHVYYVWEYRKFLHDAGFSRIQTKPWLFDTTSVIGDLKRDKAKKALRLMPRILVHAAWNFTLWAAARFTPIREMLTRASLLPVDFIAHA